MMKIRMTILKILIPYIDNMPKMIKILIVF